MSPRPRNPGSKDLPPNCYKKTDARNGVTYYKYRDPISGREFGLGKDKKIAIREAIEANYATSVQPTLTDRMSAAPVVPERLFSAWLDEYQLIYAERKQAASSTKTVNMRLKRLAKAFGDKDIRKITTMDVAGYLSGIAKDGKAQMSKALRSLLRDVFVEGMAAGWCDSNPIDATKAARVKIKRERLTLDLWKSIYEEADKPWLRRAMELAVLTGQRRDDIKSMVFKDDHDGYLHVIQSKTGTRLRISTSLRLEVLNLELSSVIKACRDRVLSQHLVHYTKSASRAKAGQSVALESLTRAFSQARDKAGIKLGITFGKQPPSFHEMRSLAARLHKAEGRNPQSLLGHKSSTMTDLYQDTRGSEWIDVA